MTRSVFKRFLFFSLIVALVCVLIVCGILTMPVSDFIESSKQINLEQNSRNIAEFLGEVAEDDIHSLANQESEVFDISVKTITESTNSVLVVIDTNGEIVHSTAPNFLKGQTLPQKAMSLISDGVHFEHGTLQNIYNQQYYICAVPVTANAGGTDTIGYCLVAQTTLWTSDYIPSVFMVLLVVIALAVITIFIMASVYAYNATRPLKLMAEAAKRFAVGDFESRVYVNSKDEMGELAQAFNEMADSLASSEGMRRNFVANVSHELKTPMTTIAGYIDGILDGTIPPREQNHYLRIVSTEVKRLSRLVTSMISLSKIDSGELSVKKTSFVLQDTAFSVLLGFENEIAKKHLRIEGLEDDTDTVAYGDKDLIYQVIYNLVENAIKFTDEEGYIRFGFSSKGGKTYVYIENSGAGVLPEDLRLIFDKFYKADKSRSANKNSMGLGLYIVRTIVLLHGGNITAESEPGEFCRFIFWLPDPPGKHRELPDTIKEDK
ncbi:MAG: HAMP domain-containing histidine kinase [Clostridia bacterium]|nr:HAMP domain-containing histidine kinase [Clostridia bacterium]